MTKSTRLRTAVLVAAAMFAGVGPALPQTAADDRRQRGEEVIRSLNKGQPQPALEALRREFPFLAEATEGYALGEVWARPGLDARTRQIATVAVFAALGHPAYMKVHAGYALNAGVTEEELKEVVYLTTVHAGFPRAIDAAGALSDLFAERRRGAAQ
jgi:4-carboxymuconolactone decarboxylase